MAAIPPEQETPGGKPGRETDDHANKLLEDPLTPERDPALTDAEWIRRVVDEEIARLRGHLT